MEERQKLVCKQAAGSQTQFPLDSFQQQQHGYFLFYLFSNIYAHTQSSHTNRSTTLDMTMEIIKLLVIYHTTAIKMNVTDGGTQSVIGPKICIHQIWKAL